MSLTVCVCCSNFSNNTPVDSIETEKTRIVLHQVEHGWWILASIDLTQLPSIRSQKLPAEAAVEYSAREVAPTCLLVTQIVQAHSIFMLHQAGSLDDLHSRLGRPAFCATLDRYWTKFARNWDVLLHGNPAADVYNATKLAGGGEIGVGVGEEDWGSGEREVLEDYVRRTDGLLDLVVARYGDAPGEPLKVATSDVTGAEAAGYKAWLGTSNDPRASDGVVFSGVGALSPRSLATISQWTDAIFRYGDEAYGIGENPSSRPRPDRRGRRPENPHRKAAKSTGKPSPKQEVHPKKVSTRNKAKDYRKAALENAATPPGIPAPLVGNVERSLADATKNVQRGDGASKTSSDEPNGQEEASYFDGDTMMKWMKMGYGSSWTLNPRGFSTSKEDESVEDSSAAVEPDQSVALSPSTMSKPLEELEPTPEATDDETDSAEPFVQRLEQSIGKFLIGLSGDLENTEFEADAMGETNKAAIDAIRNTQRIFMRTLTVRLAHRQRLRSDSAPKESSDPYDKLQVAVYIHQPFIFLFLFDLHTPSLSMPSFYRSIHHQLGPMQKALLRSTDPLRIPERLAEAVGASAEELGASGIYDLVFDPTKLTVRTSMPNVPVPGTLAAEGILGVTRPDKSRGDSRTISGAWYTLGIPIGPATPTSQYRDSAGEKLLKSEWTRVESLNVHTQVLNTYMVTRSGQVGATDIERTVKSSRGWWVVWMRVPVSMSMTAITPSPSPSPSAFFADIVKQGRQDEYSRGNESEAFLIRKAVDTAKNSSSALKERSGKWLLREGRDISGASGASASGTGAAAVTSARGVVEGVGVDARRWVEGLVKMSS